MEAFGNPIFWAVMVGWIISVILHEFAHGVVAYWGGDYTIRERGGLSLNPLQYIDPMFSLVIPAIMLMIGAIPLPGGVTYIRRDLIRNRAWQTAVSLAGPCMNLILFFICILPLHPKFHVVDPNASQTEWSNWSIFLATTAVLQFISLALNLVPVPPLDGFQAVAPYLPHDLREKMERGPMNQLLFIGFFMVVWQTNFLGIIFTRGLIPMLVAMGYDEGVGDKTMIDFVYRAWRIAFSK